MLSCLLTRPSFLSDVIQCHKTMYYVNITIWLIGTALYGYSSIYWFYYHPEVVLEVCPEHHRGLHSLTV